jgi:SHS2 domain-containing protein
VADANRPAGYDYFEVEADVGLVAWGPTLADAFAEAALGALALTVEPAEVEAREIRHVRAQGQTPETLLVAWLNECLYVGEIESFAAHRVSVTALDGGVAHGMLHGEPIAPGRHRLGTVVKAVTMHKVRIEQLGPGRVQVAVVVDV